MGCPYYVSDSMTAWDEENSEGIGCLPDELLHLIFKSLPLETLLVCENVCSRWRKLSRDSTLWKRFLIIFSGKPGQTEVSSKSLEVINSHGHLISHLKFQYVYNYQDIKSILLKCSNLVSIELVMCRLGKEFEENVQKWPNLRKLNMKNSLLMANEDLAINYGQLKELRLLALSNFGLSLLNCKSLLQLQYLNHILIEKIKNLNLDFIKELIISKREILKTFHMYGGDCIDDQVLQLISQCPLLRDLAIMSCENVTDRGLMSLVNLKNILRLQIWNNSNFSETVLLQTLSSPNLITLNTLSLSRIMNVSPVIVDIISEYYKGLKFLALYQCPQIINTDYEKQLKSKFQNIDDVLY